MTHQNVLDSFLIWLLAASSHTAADIMLEAPTETHGIESSILLGSVDLSGDFKELEGRHLRSRQVRLEPGAVVGVHPHEKRPAVVYLLEGEMMEYRSDEKKGILRKKGDVSFEETGMSHWWRNESDSFVLLFVVDMVPESDLD